MAEAATSTPASRQRTSGCVRWAAILLLAFGLIGGFLTWQFFGYVSGAFAWLRNLPQNLVAQEITVSFRESVTKIAATQGDILEVATMQTDETITKADNKSAFNNFISLGTTVSEIRTPVVYRYHIKLSDAWDMSVVDGHCTVKAPAMRPSLPPAIRTEGMEKKSEAGWLRFNADENLANLEKNLTAALERRAGNKTHLDLVREAARKSVAEFVKKWLLTQQTAEAGQIRSITIIFPDETLPPGPVTVPPTLKVP